MASLLAAVLASASLAGIAHAQFNNPPGVDIWCGKAYRPENASFNPGGWLHPPKESDGSMLDVRFYPRHSLYTSLDRTGSFIVNANLSRIHGIPFNDDGVAVLTGSLDAAQSPFDFTITLTESGKELVSDSVALGTTGNEIPFSLDVITPRLDPYNVTLTVTAGPSSSIAGFQTYAELLRLPARKSKLGSTSRLDNLHGTLQVLKLPATAGSPDPLAAPAVLSEREPEQDFEWVSVFPYGYYVSWGGWMNDSIDNLKAYHDAGYNLLHLIPGGGDDPFGWDRLEEYLDTADQLDNLYLMYDMRHTYQNDTLLRAQIDRVKSHKSIVLWYTADEPDGVGDPLNATVTAQRTIRALDPYRPISLALNCANFHYDAYTAGADIVLADTYPLHVNTTYSTVYHIVCNVTYGCCGCDDCAGRLDDVAARLAAYQQYEAWLGRQPRKSVWFVPQAFGGGDDPSFWSAPPSPAEEMAMQLLALIHGAKGLCAWTYPTTDAIAAVTSAFAQRVATAAGNLSIVDFLTTFEPERLSAPAGVFAAAWGSHVANDTLMMAIVYAGTADLARGATVALPFALHGWVAEGLVWGDPRNRWWVTADGKRVEKGYVPRADAYIQTFRRRKVAEEKEL